MRSTWIRLVRTECPSRITRLSIGGLSLVLLSSLPLSFRFLLPFDTSAVHVWIPVCRSREDSSNRVLKALEIMPRSGSSSAYEDESLLQPSSEDDSIECDTASRPEYAQSSNSSIGGLPRHAHRSRYGYLGSWHAFEAKRSMDHKVTHIL